ncbi:MAG TPA: zinc-binding alcohol dehydrogenase family protein [Terriglobia bacterium]|nr:zinc-binding alcohol dehydrogenase family protein [Terriglobia bacterium]
MNAAVLRALGQAPHFEEFPEPTPGEREALVHVTAAALKPVDRQMAAGTHYASPRQLPAVCGTDGVGRLDDGRRVLFGGARPPYGAMAERTVAPRAFCWPVPDGVDDVTAAALVNPGLSAWLSLTSRAGLQAGQTVLILGATGVTGRLAIQISKQLGAARVVAAGRNPQSLASLPALGADAVIALDQSDAELSAAFAREAGENGFDVVLDYLWGRPTEALLAALTRPDFKPARSARTRLVQVGESAGPSITLPAAALRSSGLEIVGAGSGAIPPLDVLQDGFRLLMEGAACGELSIDTARVPLAQVESAWEIENPQRRRLVIIP